MFILRLYIGVGVNVYVTKVIQVILLQVLLGVELILKLKGGEKDADRLE